MTPSTASRKGAGEAEASASTIDEGILPQLSNIDLEVGNDPGVQEKTMENELAAVTTEDEVYTTFTRAEITFIAIMASISTFYSPLTASIYFPALNTISAELGVSETLVNLTVTTYMIFQGLAPAVVGGLSDSLGRRPLYIICFVLYIIANIALGAQNSYAGLMVLRCLQSSGISGTVALSNAAIADIITSAERGTYIGWATVGGALGPSLSPIIGGLLSQYLGYHSIFWFLAIFGGVYLVILLLLFPETCRKIVGNGSIPPPRYSRSFLNYRDEKKRRKAGEAIDFSKRDELAAKRRGLKIPNPIMATLVMVAELETGLLLIFMGLLYAGLYFIFTGIPSQFSALYAFSNTELGLVFLAPGLGGIIAAITQGKLLDWNYARHAKRLGVPVSKSRQQDLTNFPIERARLEISVPIVFLASLLMIAYGWVIDYGVHVSAPIVILFFIGYLSIASFNPLSILIVELHPQSPGTATAAMNLVRCLLGAGATAVVLPMLEAMGRGWANTFVGLVQIAIIPLLVAIIRWGPMWRARQRKRDERRRERKDGKANGVDGRKGTKEEHAEVMDETNGMEDEENLDAKDDKMLELQEGNGLESSAAETDIEKA